MIFERFSNDFLIFFHAFVNGFLGFQAGFLQIFGSYAHYFEASELLEDAAAVFAQLGGAEALLRRLQSEPPSSLLRVAGLKALFEDRLTTLIHVSLTTKTYLRITTVVHVELTTIT